jgi:hypothetical protein
MNVAKRSVRSYVANLIAWQEDAMKKLRIVKTTATVILSSLLLLLPARF